MKYTVSSADDKYLEYCKSTRHLRNVLRKLSHHNYNDSLEIKGFKKINGNWSCVITAFLLKKRPAYLNSTVKKIKVQEKNLSPELT